jgi:hypothetical protein
VIYSLRTKYPLHHAPKLIRDRFRVRVRGEFFIFLLVKKEDGRKEGREEGRNTLQRERKREREIKKERERDVTW